MSTSMTTQNHTRFQMVNIKITVYRTGTISLRYYYSTRRLTKSHHMVIVVWTSGGDGSVFVPECVKFPLQSQTFIYITEDTYPSKGLLHKFIPSVPSQRVVGTDMVVRTYLNRTLWDTQLIHRSRWSKETKVSLSFSSVILTLTFYLKLFLYLL